MTKIAICDDDRQCLEEARALIEKWAAEYDKEIIVSPFEDGDALLEHQKEEPFDVLFLDIMMPFLNGMDVAHEIRRDDEVTKIVFLTSSPEFAVESYDVRASGYLLKPVDYSKLCTCLNNCTKGLEKEPENLIVKTVDGYQKLFFKDIECLEAQNRNVKFTLKDGECVWCIGTFSHYEDVLTVHKGFYKCHRSYVVSMDKVDQFNSTNIVTKSGFRIPIARGLAKPFKEAYFAFMFEKGKG